jgi:multicomponent Na+:H+ antiporter subunit G
MDALHAAAFARNALGGLVIAVGLAFIVGGAIGLLRFPDFYTRLHAARVSDAVGATILLIGLAILAPDGALALRVLLLAALTAALGPTLSHLAANAAHAAGLAPLSGKYTAPRPGAQRETQP